MAGNDAPRPVKLSLLAAMPYHLPASIFRTD
jgi:hypothetical protein